MTAVDVLLVDDDDATRDGLRELLALNGFSVQTAQNGQQALDTIRGHSVGVVLLDVNLPGMGGLEVLARCAQAKGAEKIIVVTGMDTPETVLGALREHAYDFLPKPVDPAHLIATVRRALAAPDTPPIEVLSARPEWVELLVPCSREAVGRIQSFLHQLESDLPQDLRDSVGLAFHELLMNGIEWGGQLDPSQTMRVACLRTRRMLLYRIADPGQGFKLHELPHAASADRSDPIAHDQIRQEQGLRAGGFGLTLIRAIADELVYNEQRNEVVFVKYLEPLAEGSRSDARLTVAKG